MLTSPPGDHRSGPSPSLLSSRAVGDRNRATVLRALADHGPLARTELADVTGVTRATIGGIVGGLVSDGILVEEPGPAGVRRGVGKPARPLWFAAGAGPALSIEVRARAVRGAVVDARGELGPVHDVELHDPTSTEEVASAATAVARRLAATTTAIGIGVVVPGTCDTNEGRVIGSSQVPGAIGVRLTGELAGALGLPVQLENDARAQALAEHWFGAGRGYDSFVSVQTGAGLGAGIVLGGALHRGVEGRGGEVGHAPVVVDGVRCPCGLRGCWETIATLRWVRGESARAGLRGARSMDAARLAAGAAGGDRAAVAVLDRYAAHLAIGLAVLTQVLQPARAILQGDAATGGDQILRRVQAELDRRTFASVPVVLGQLDQPALLGGGAGVLAAELHRVAGGGAGLAGTGS